MFFETIVKFLDNFKKIIEIKEFVTPLWVKDQKFFVRARSSTVMTGRGVRTVTDIHMNQQRGILNFTL